MSKKKDIEKIELISEDLRANVNLPIREIVDKINEIINKINEE